MKDKLTKDFYCNAICSVMRDVCALSAPVVRGTNSRIFIAEDYNTNKTVFRFNPRQVAHRNHDISQVLYNHGIPVPRVKLHMYHGQYFESYPFIPGLTLQECLTQGMSQDEILDVYAMMAHQMNNMAKISTRNFQNIENKNCSSVAQSNIVYKTNNWLLGQFVKCGTMLLNAGPQSVCHCDFTPYNIVMNDAMRISGVLDLNAVSIANINFSLAITGLSLRKNKLNPNDFYRVCDDVMPGKLYRPQLNLAEKICERYFKEYTK